MILASTSSKKDFLCLVPGISNFHPRQHVAFVYDSSAKTQSIYLDGSLDTTCSEASMQSESKLYTSVMINYLVTFSSQSLLNMTKNIESLNTDDTNRLESEKAAADVALAANGFGT